MPFRSRIPTVRSSPPERTHIASVANKFLKMAFDLGKGTSKTFSKTSTNTSKNDEEEDEQLYLLEVIVDKIDVFKEGILETFQESPQPTASAGSVKKDEEEQPAGPLRVLVKFFDFPTIEIQEKEFKKETKPTETDEKVENEMVEPTEEEETIVKKTPLIKENDAILKSKKQEEARWRAEGKLGKDPPVPTQYPGPIPPGQRFVSGKSCLFPMVPKEMVEVIKKYPLEIQVHRDATDIEPAHLIGTARLNLGQEFIDAIATACTPSVLPVTAYIQGEYGVSNVFGDTTGSLNLLIRMSCFGATIFTQFKYIQGQQGFKFSTSEGVMTSKGNQERMAKAQKKEESKSDLSEGYIIERPPFLTQDVDIAMFTSPTLIDEFKVPVPWRKLTDEPITPQTCGPKRLFKDIPRPRKDETFDLGELFPSVNRTVPEQQAFYPGQPIITGNTFEDCSCRGQAIPATSRQVQFGRSPAEIHALPGQGGSGAGLLEIPPGTIFPCQFGQDWVVEAQPCECPSPHSSRKKKPKNKADLFPCPYYSSSGIGKNLNGPQQSQSCPWFDQDSQPPIYGWSQSQTSRGEYPSLEQASPLLRSAPPPNTSESQTGEYCVIGEPCFLGARPANQNRPNEPSENQTAYGTFPKTRGNITYSNKSDVQYVSCPSTSSGQRTTVVCGLEGLIDPNQRNLQNMLQPGLMDPLCPPDSSRAQPSLCSCPKVPKSIPQPPPAGDLRCECTNILTSMKPMDLTYTCQQKLDSQATTVPTTSTAAPTPPMPNKQSHPNPECPLASMLKQAEKEGAVDQNRTAPLKPEVAEPSSKTGGLGKADPEGVDKADSPKTVSEPTSKSALTPDDQTQGKATKKGAEKAKKILQDEAAAHTTMASYMTEPTVTGRIDDTRASKASSLTSYSSGSKKKSKKKHKKAEATREQMPPPGTLASIYPGSVVGHKHCVPVIRWVPKKMGWLWNIKDADGFMKPGRGWRPGSIPTNVIKIMDNVKTSKNRNEKNTMRPYRKAEGYKHMAAGGGDGPLFKPVDDTPTVHLHKKHGKLYLSLCPPSKDYAKKKRPTTSTQASKGSKGETAEEDSDDDSNRPAQFRIDLKNPDGVVLDPDLYETEETSSNSEDSYQMEIVAPSTLRNRQPQPFKIDFEVQVTEENFIQPSYDAKQAHQDRSLKKPVKMDKKRSAASKKSVGKRSVNAK